MKVLATCGALALMALSAQALPIIILPPPNVSGTWTFTAVSGNSPAAIVYTGPLTQSGTNLAGFAPFTSSGSSCSDSVSVTGTVIFGGGITINVNVNGQQRTLTGTVSSDGNTANGNYTSDSGGCLAGNSGTWTATRAQQVLPQFAFGGGWYSALYFTNEGTNAASFLVSFYDDNGNPLTVPAINGTSTTVSIPANGSASIMAPNVGTLSEGSVFMSLPGGVTGYGVFRQSLPGISDQEAVVPLSSVSNTTSRMIWDDTSSTTAFAVVNTSSIAISVNIAVHDSQGASLGTSTLHLGPLAKMTGTLRTLPGISSVAGNSGTADFTEGFGIILSEPNSSPRIVTQGTLALLGLRFRESALTSIPTTDRFVFLIE